uniref:BTB domain-containing protein n=1 Tax=Timema tahoe TaxID=61484 RepID=A0A7R9I8W2_9NEOP|nr:unnamed protein product [Timema tahoe]
MSDTDAEQFSLRWNNFHSNLSSGFHALLQGEDLVDVTLAAGGNFVQAHKIVLSVCSPYFKELFKVNPCKHPIVIMKDVGHKELVSILEFMYLGEVNVRQEELSSFLKTAETLQVKGLTGDDSPAPLASHPQRKQTATRKHSSVLEPLVVHSEESPTRPIKRARVGAPPPTPPFTSSPHNSPALRLMPSSPAHSENLRDNAVVLTKPKQEPIKEVGLTRPKQEPTEYDSDIEEVTLDEKMLRGHDPLMNVNLDQTFQRGDEHPLMSLLGGGSSQQQDPMAALPLFGISHDSGGSQDGGQASDMVDQLYRDERQKLRHSYGLGPTIAQFGSLNKAVQFMVTYLIRSSMDLFILHVIHHDGRRHDGHLLTQRHNCEHGTLCHNRYGAYDEV